MKAIMVMFDSLNKQMLEPYGCDWAKTPNFQRLSEKTAKFNNSYVGSMPCMPARRELHTGRYNFLHRAWGPLEPYDDSMPELLKYNGIYTHMVSDHMHYWEEGGSNYHTKYSSWEVSRGREGDTWKGEVAEPEVPEVLERKPGPRWRHDWVNRKYMQTEEQMSQYKTFKGGLEFINTNKDEDNWFLQIETFDPHEPFYALQEFKDLYPHEYDGPHFDWPPYRKVIETSEQVEHVRYEYAALVSMCDHYLGKVLDAMDENNMWDDTMLIVNTDHGFLLGEHDCWAKCVHPMFDEVANTPLFIWDPRSKQKDCERNALVQTIDIAPTLYEFFGIDIPESVKGYSLKNVVESDEPVREAALFGLFGAHINCTDGRYVYMRAPEDSSGKGLYNYTLMPSHMTRWFSEEELRTITLAPPFEFTKGISLMKIEAEAWQPPSLYLSDSGEPERVEFDNSYVTMLFDLEEDSQQLNPIADDAIEEKMKKYMVSLMKDNDSPPEQFSRVGLNSNISGRF